jgi:phosphoribosylformylglycinamidine synthase
MLVLWISATGWCIAFKVESHNHPSLSSRFQGAATGVGGYSCATFFHDGRTADRAMNSLRFWALDDKKQESETKRS